MGQAICEHLGGFQRRLEEESPGKEELNSYPQTAVFPVAVTGWRKDQRFLLARERLSVMEFPPAVGKLEAGLFCGCWLWAAFRCTVCGSG